MCCLEFIWPVDLNSPHLFEKLWTTACFGVPRSTPSSDNALELTGFRPRLCGGLGLCHEREQSWGASWGQPRAQKRPPWGRRGMLDASRGFALRLVMQTPPTWQIPKVQVGRRKARACDTCAGTVSLRVISVWSGLRAGTVTAKALGSKAPGQASSGLVR